MILNEGIKWPEDMHPAMWYARAVVDAVHVEMTGQVATCTSGYRLQTPGGSSLHPLKRAMDIRTWLFGEPSSDLGRESVRKFAAVLRRRLGDDFDVIVEGKAAEDAKYVDRPPHVHIEYEGGRYA